MSDIGVGSGNQYVGINGFGAIPTAEDDKVQSKEPAQLTGSAVKLSPKEAVEISGDIREQKLGQLSGVPKSGGANVLAEPDKVKVNPQPVVVDKQAGVGGLALIGDVEKIEMSASNPPNNSSDAFVDLLGGIPEGCTVEQLTANPQLLADILAKMQTAGKFMQFEALYMDKVPEDDAEHSTELSRRQDKLNSLTSQYKKLSGSDDVDRKLDLLFSLGRSETLRDLFSDDENYGSISENIGNFASSFPEAAFGSIKSGAEDPFSALNEEQISDLKVQIQDALCPSVEQCVKEFKSFVPVAGGNRGNFISHDAQMITKSGDLILSMMAEVRRELRESGKPFSEADVDAKVASKVSDLIWELDRGEKGWLLHAKNDPRINWDNYSKVDFSLGEARTSQLVISAFRQPVTRSNKDPETSFCSYTEDSLNEEETSQPALKAGKNPVAMFIRDPELALASDVVWDFCSIKPEEMKETLPALIGKYAAKLHCEGSQSQSSQIEIIHKFVRAKIQGNPEVLRLYTDSIKDLIDTCCSQIKTLGSSEGSIEIADMYKDIGRLLLIYDMGDGESVSSPLGPDGEFVQQLGKVAKEDMTFAGTFKNWLVNLFVSIARFFNSETTKTTYTEDFIMEKLEKEILSEENVGVFKQVIRLASIDKDNVNDLITEAILTMFEKINIDGDTREAVVKRFTKKLEESGVFAP